MLFRSAAAATPTTRKTARKTAHSLIERRRRSKMNAEFEVLKNLVPACAGVEMHKLAILQASIEYVRYLERCVAELQRGGGAASVPLPSLPACADDDDEDEDEDEDMPDKAVWQHVEPPTVVHPPSSFYEDRGSYTTTASSSAPTSPEFSASAHSTTTSPVYAFPATASSLRLPSISPLLFPQAYGAGALETTGAGALLMLADEGRRNSQSGARPRTGSVRGMSVRDLLSS